MNILSYFNIIVNIKTLLPFIMYKTSYFFDFLINAPYFIKLKRSPLDTRGPFPAITTRAIFGIYRLYGFVEVISMKIYVSPDYLCAENIYSGLMI